MLTKKQRELLLLIHDYMQKDGIAPSFEEMKKSLNLQSKSGIHRLITGLEERGYIRRLPHRARALEILKMPDGHTEDDHSPSQENNVFKKAMDTLSNAAFSEVPLLGKIAAGTPIEAIQHNDQFIPVPQNMIDDTEHYALTIEGDSMIKAGIHDSDTVIIKRCDTAHNGEIIVALVDEYEATLKRLRKAGNKIVLEPENDDYEPRILEPGRVKIQGRLVSLLRQY